MKSRGRRIEKEGNSFVLREEKLSFLTNPILPSERFITLMITWRSITVKIGRDAKVPSGS